MTDFASDAPRKVVPALSGVYAALDPLALPLLRLTTGLLLVPHGAQKLFGLFGGGGLSGTTEMFAGMGLTPAGFFALFVGVVEVFGGLALAIGLLTRPAALAVFGMMAVILFGFHWSSGFFWYAGGWEYPALWAVAALVFVIKGGGALSVDRAIGREL